MCIDSEQPQPPTEAELNASANRRDAAKGYEVISDMEDDLATIGNLTSALMLVAESLYSPNNPRESAALYGLANGIEDALDRLKEGHEEASRHLWGYGPGAHRVTAP